LLRVPLDTAMVFDSYDTGTHIAVALPMPNTRASLHIHIRTTAGTDIHV
jgi:hypothetical protein